MLQVLFQRSQNHAKGVLPPGAVLGHNGVAERLAVLLAVVLLAAETQQRLALGRQSLRLISLLFVRHRMAVFDGLAGQVGFVALENVPRAATATMLGALGFSAGDTGSLQINN